MTAKEMFKRFKKTVGNGRNGSKVAQANREITIQLAADFQRLKETKDPQTNKELFRLVDFMNARANELRRRINEAYTLGPGVDLMKPNAFNAILEAKAPVVLEAYETYRRFKTSNA